MCVREKMRSREDNWNVLNHPGSVYVTCALCLPSSLSGIACLFVFISK
jgi:hypothetical protein